MRPPLKRQKKRILISLVFYGLFGLIFIRLGRCRNNHTFRSRNCRSYGYNSADKTRCRKSPRHTCLTPSLDNFASRNHTQICESSVPYYSTCRT